MDTTPVTHRPRRGRIALGKGNATPVQLSTNSKLVSTVIVMSPNTSPPFVSTPTTSRHTPPGPTANIDRTEKLTRSALRREFLLEEDEDDFIMPCSQIQNPSDNGQVFWNYNASPATVRAREALEKKMRQTEDDKKGRKNENKQIVPSPLQRLPLPTRRKVTSTNEDKSAKESERRREADEMLNSMKQIFQAEIQKHQVPFKTEFGDELNDGKISSSGSSTDRLSDSHLQCSSNSPTPSDGGNDIPTQKSKPADPLKPAHNTNINENVYQKTSASSRYNSPALLHDTLGEGNKSLGIEGLVSDDDSFILKCSQAIDKEYLENNEKPSFAKPHLVQVNSNTEIKDCTTKCASYNTDVKNAHRTNNGKNLLPDSVNISGKSEPIDRLKGHSNRKELPNKNYQEQIELKVCETFFDSDDDFDTMLSQMEMPEVPKSPIPSNLAIRGISVKGKQADIFKNISSDYHKSSTTSTYKSSNLKNDKDHVQIEETQNASNLDRKFSSMRDKRLENKSKFELESVIPVVVDNSYKRFRSAPGAAASTEQQSKSSEYSKASKSFGRRSYSTPDATPTHNQLPGGRDVSVKLSDQHNMDGKPKCTKEEIERKRLEAVKKREIERKRQEAIKKRQINSQKNISKVQ